MFLYKAIRFIYGRPLKLSARADHLLQILYLSIYQTKNYKGLTWPYYIQNFYIHIYIKLQNLIQEMDWFSNICNCFNPQIRSKILDYLNSQQLNSQVIQQEKCTQSQADNQSIYDKAKAKSYYFIKHQDTNSQQQSPSKSNVIQYHNDNAIDDHDSSFYPMNKTYEQIYNHKLKVIKMILNEELLTNEHYLKVYDSQDQNRILVYALNKTFLQKQKDKRQRQNIYRFQFSLRISSECSTTVKDFVDLNTETQLKQSLTESLLKYKETIQKDQKNNLSVFYRTYNKILVITQHDFVTTQKSELIQELNEQQSTQDHQVYEQYGYSIAFSVKGIKEEISAQFNRGWINLCGLRVKKEKKAKKSQNEQQVEYTAQDKQIQEILRFEGFINIELDTTVNSNMLRQPIAKQIRAYIQKLICLLQKSDAI